MAIVVVRTSPKVEASTNVVNSSFVGTPSPGNHIIAVGNSYNSSSANAAPTVTDNASGGSNSYNIDKSQVGLDINVECAHIASTKVVRTLNNLQTTTTWPATSLQCTAMAMEVSGLADSPVDVAVSQTGTPHTSPWTQASGTLAQADELIVSAWSYGASGLANWSISLGTWSGVAPVTLYIVDGAGATGEYGAAGYRIVSSTSSVTSSFSASAGGTSDSPVVLVSYKAQRAPKLIAVTSQPTDNSTQVGPSLTVDKDAGALSFAQAGDLIVCHIQTRTAAGSVGDVFPTSYNTGGQVWSVVQPSTNNGVILGVAWCTFNGTWSADPTFTDLVSGNTDALTVVATIWRPSTSGNIWQPNWSAIGVQGSFSAPGSPFTCTITGITPTTMFGSQSHLIIAAFGSADDNTWNSLAGTNWVQTGLDAQYRNTSASQQSLALAYQTQFANAATNNVSLNQATLGGDAGSTMLIAFTEVAEPSGAGDGSTGVVNTDLNEDATSATSITVTLSSAPVSGNGIAGMGHYENSGLGILTSITDNQSNQYYLVQIVTYNFLNQTAFSFWRPNITNAPTTLTANFSATEGWRGLAVVESDQFKKLNKYTGRFAVAGNPFGVDVITTDAVTPTVSDALFVGWTTNVDAAQTAPYYTVQSPWTMREFSSGGQNNQSLHTYKQGAAASQAFTVSVNPGRDNHALMMAFESGAPPAPPAPPVTPGASMYLYA